MKKGIRMAGGWCVASCLALWGAACQAQEGEPEIDGKPLSAWVKQLRSENRGLQLRAARTLGAAPASLHARIVPLVIPVLKSERENDRFAAAQVLGECGPAARAAVPDLLPVLEGTQYERNRAAAAKSLGLILKDAKPDEEVEKVTRALAKAFADPYSDVRREAGRACGTIGPAAKACIPELPRLFEDPKYHAKPVGGPTWEEMAMVQSAGIWAAGRMGTLAACHVDRLVALLQGHLGADAAEAIGRIGATQENVVPNLMAVIERGNFWENIAAKDKALAALEAFGPKSAPAVSLLDRFLREKTFPPKQTLAILRVLKSIGPAAKPAEAALKQCLEMKDYPHAKPEELEPLRKAAGEALGAVTGK